MLYYGSETLDMTSKQLGEMFEGDSADMCAKKFRWCRCGLSGEASVQRPGREDPHRCHLIFYNDNTATQNSLILKNNYLFSSIREKDVN